MMTTDGSDEARTPTKKIGTIVGKMGTLTANSNVTIGTLVVVETRGTHKITRRTHKIATLLTS